MSGALRDQAARERIAGELDVEPRRRGRRRAPARRRVLVERVDQRARDRARRPSTSWS